jgi:outer membrane receptor protein involved in Fe transport
VKHFSLLAAAAPAAFWAGGLAAQTPGLEEIIVTADFREQSIADLPVSVSVLDEADIRTGSLQHFEELILQVPNLNWSGEGSRARYFQLRGIGELEQYEGAPNPSIGFIVDDIDFSGLGSIGTLFDIERIEVLRGPQGTRYGANALGGLIYMRSMAPTDELAADFEATTGNDGTLAVGAAAGGPINDALGYRASVHQYQSDGFRHNAYLNRDDTYGRDELTARGRLSWATNDNIDIDFSGLYVDLDNGYDAWTIDNGFTTHSDKPGKDAQRSLAASIRVLAELLSFDIVSISGAAQTDATFSFDADWGNDAFWAPAVYDFFTNNERDRRAYNQEIRLLSKPGAIAGGRGEWLVGMYGLDLTESNDRVDVGRDDFACNPCFSEVTSEYDATNLALFGQIDLGLTDRLGLAAGLRWEQRAADYVDTSGNSFSPRDDMLGGELALTRRLDEQWSSYVRVARGYKAGGFNLDFAGVDFEDVDGLTPQQIEFGPESLTSLEIGIRGQTPGGGVRADVSIFVAQRDDQQIKIPLQLRLGDPSSFLFLTANSERGKHRGLEATVDWLPTDALTISASLGRLHTEISDFALFPELQGREQAHAPDYTLAVGAEYRARSGWWGRLDVTAMDEFFFDYSHNQRSQRYSVANLRVGREWGQWGVTVWTRNLFDEEYFARGFFFANEPPDFPEKLYTRLGDPRHYGVTVKFKL